MSPVRINVLRPAEVRRDPSPRPRQDAGLGLLAGAVLGTGLAILREVLDTTVKTLTTISDLGAPALGSVPAGEGGDRPELVVEGSRSPSPRRCGRSAPTCSSPTSTTRRAWSS